MGEHIIDLGSDDDTPEATEESAEESEVDESEFSDDFSDIDDDDDFKAQLKDCLDDVQCEGSFSAFRRHELYPNPGLYVKEFGFIGLPLSDRDAEAIAALCKRSPFGKGDETVVDESVRKTWELEASQIECRNPAWAAFEKTLANQAITDIGVQVSALAQPYKLLLYEEGAFFKAHRDTEKVPGMFGTMIVCLPSEHTGGEVHLTHHQKRQILETADSSAYNLSTLAWYSDVQHEIKPVLSGYRLVLTYNLVQDQTRPKQTAAAQDANHERLERLMRAWNRNFYYQDHFVYPLSFKYTENSLSQSYLKGVDEAKSRYLDEVCAREDVCWFLAQMTKQKEEEDYYGYHDNDGDNDEHSLRWTVLPNGQSINLGLYFVDVEALLADQDELYEDRDPDSEDEGEYTGNENMPATHRYHDTVIVLMRKDGVLSNFRMESTHSPESLLAYFGLLLADAGQDSQRRQDALNVILEKAMNLLKMKDNDTSYQVIHLLGYGEKQQERKRAEYAKVFETVADFCYLNGLSDTVSQLIRDAMKDKDWTSSNSLVSLVAKQVAMEASSGKGDVWNDWLSTTLPSTCTYAYANQQRATYDRIEATLPTTSVSSSKEWKTACIEEIVRAVRTYSKDDAQSIVDLIPNLAPQTYFECIISMLVENPDAAGLSRLLYLLATSSVVSQEHIVKPTFERLAQAANATLKLSIEEVMAPHLSQYDHDSETARWEELVEIVECCLKLGLEQQGAQLLGTSLPDIPEMTSHMRKKWKLLFRFLDSVVMLSSRHFDTDLPDQVKPFIGSLVHTVAGSFVGTRPQKPCTWAQDSYCKESRHGYRHERCSCAPCKALQAFLANAKERVGRFRYNESTRSHLRYELDSVDFKFDTEKGKSPYTLVITKTHNKYERKLEKWKDKIGEFRQELEDLDVPLQPLGISATGAADLDAQLVAAGASEGVMQAARPLQPASASTQNLAPPRQVTGVKRKSDVIDLTEN